MDRVASAKRIAHNDKTLSLACVLGSQNCAHRWRIHQMEHCLKCCCCSKMEIAKDYPLFIAIYLAVGLFFHQKGVKFLPDRETMFGFTNYGLFCGLGVFLAGMLLTKCNVNFLFIAAIAVMPILLRYFFCNKRCSKTYNITLFYLFIIPVVLLLYPCQDIAVITTAIAIASAFGRIGCSCAGCCTGPVVSCEQFHYKHSDPKQIVNLRNKTTSTCSTPTLIGETIVQFLIVWLCLRYPEHAPKIFGIGTGILVLLTQSWRDRLMAKKTGLMFLLIPLVCLMPVKGICLNPSAPKIAQSFTLAAIVALTLSKNWFTPNGEGVL